jgi:hypothetical protein
MARLLFLHGMGILVTLLRVYPYQATVRGTKFERRVGVPSFPLQNGKNDQFFAESDHVILEHVSYLKKILIATSQ